MEKKYELIKSSAKGGLGCGKLYRIKALRDFGDVKKGDLGGFVESEHNLSHEDECWIYNTAKVWGNARVKDNAKIYNNCEICGDSDINDNAILSSHSRVYNGKIYGNVRLKRVLVDGNATISGNAKISNSHISGAAWICGNAVVTTDIHGNPRIGDNANIRSRNDYMDFTIDFDNSNAMFAPGRYCYTFFRSGREDIMVAEHNGYGYDGVFSRLIEEYENSLHNKSIKFLTYDDECVEEISRCDQLLMMCKLARFHITGKE